MMQRLTERLVHGEIEASFVLVAASVGVFVAAAVLWWARRVRGAAQRRTTTRS